MKAIVELRSVGADLYDVVLPNGAIVVSSYYILGTDIVEANNDNYIKDAIKLKDAGFTAEEIIEVMGRKKG